MALHFTAATKGVLQHLPILKKYHFINLYCKCINSYIHFQIKEILGGVSKIVQLNIQGDPFTLLVLIEQALCQDLLQNLFNTYICLYVNYLLFVTFNIVTCVVRCSDPPKESFGSMGKQHQRMKAMKATLVPTNRMKSSMLCRKGVI